MSGIADGEVPKYNNMELNLLKNNNYKRETVKRRLQIFCHGFDSLLKPIAFAVIFLVSAAIVKKASSLHSLLLILKFSYLNAGCY